MGVLVRLEGGCVDGERLPAGCHWDGVEVRAWDADVEHELDCRALPGSRRLAVLGRAQPLEAQLCEAIGVDFAVADVDAALKDGIVDAAERPLVCKFLERVGVDLNGGL